jgi:asparagine synthase (glutamine-hydrolysing)
MTAIGGCWSFDGALDPLEACGRILRAQPSYVSVEPVRLLDQSLAIGKRLYATLPEDVFDTGPYVSSSGRWSLVADVRLDNRSELCAKLGILREETAFLADSAILGMALDRWSEDALVHMLGDFAFAAWDRERARLLLARDAVGRRPLHYHRCARFFAFSSMPSGLHAVPGVSSEPNEEAVARLLATLPEEGSRTFFKDIERVLPGHYCLVEAAGLRSVRYWNPTGVELRLRSPAEYAEAVREQFDRAVLSRLRGADGRVACQLSGGLDSSAVTATAARLIGAQGKVTAFTTVPREGYEGAIPKGAVLDEGPQASEVVALYRNVEHVLVRTAQKSPLSMLDQNYSLYERPVLNICNGLAGSEMIGAASRRKLSVMLVGTLGNMSSSWCGFEVLPYLLARGRVFEVTRNLYKLRRERSLVSLLSQTLSPFLPPKVWHALKGRQRRHLSLSSYHVLNAHKVKQLELVSGEKALDYTYLPRLDPVGARLWAIERVDPGNYVQGNLAGWGLDLRDPTADRRLIETCLAIPPEEYLRGGQTRSIARRAFADRLPPTIIADTRRGLQAADWHEGVAGIQGEAQAEVARIAATPAARSILDIGRLQALVGTWPEGDWTSNDTEAAYRYALLRGISVGHFLRKAAKL